MKKSKILATLLICGSVILSFANVNVKSVNATEIPEIQIDTNEEAKPERYYSPVNNYFYTVRNNDFISPDSMEAWVRLPVGSTGGTIIGSGYSNLMRISVTIYGKLKVEWNGSEILHTFEDSKNIADDKWHHVAVVRTDSKLTYYLDGNVEGELNIKSYSSSKNVAFNFGAGKLNNDRIPLEGFIKQVAIYSGAITTQQIQKDMLDTSITNEDVLSDNTKLFGSWNLGEYWTERYINNEVEGATRAELYSFQKYVEFDESFGEYDYTYAIFPDIQLMTHWNPNRLHRTIQWLADNKDELKLEFAMFVGDLSDVGYTEELYERASAAMSRLDNVVPYCFVPGNHDYDDNAKTRQQEYFKTHFPIAKHSKLPGFGGAFEDDKMSNTYYTFNAKGVKYLVLNLEYKPRLSVLRWANVIVDAHPDHRVIMATHSYLTAEGLFSPISKVGNEGNGGQVIYDNLMVKHPNIFLGVGGHESMDDAFTNITYGENNNKIINMLVDAQSSRYKGDAWLDVFLLVHVNEKEKTMNLRYFSPDEGKVYNIQNQYEIHFADPNNPTIGA